jgi:hypothetical protein
VTTFIGKKEPMKKAPVKKKVAKKEVKAEVIEEAFTAMPEPPTFDLTKDYSHHTGNGNYFIQDGNRFTVTGKYVGK